MAYTIPFQNLITFRRFYNTALIVQDRYDSYLVATVTPAGHFEAALAKDYAPDAANLTALMAMEPYWNTPMGGDIFDPWSRNFALDAADWAFTVAAGKKLQVDWFRGQASNNTHFPANNPCHVVFLLTYGAPFAAWNGTRTDLSGQDWIVDSNNGVESVQEYVRKTHIVNGQWDGQVALDFAFTSMRDLVGKTKIQDITASADDAGPFKVATTDYLERGARLQLRSSMNERIECYPEAGVTYKDANNSAIDLARITVAFSRHPEF